MLLSIAIPVYNGSNTIELALKNIINQLNDEFEIIISDNASTDQTPYIIKKYTDIYPNIKYFRNSENLGADENFDLALRRSTGKFIWFLGDDDIIMPGSVKRVISEILSHENIDYLFVNCSVWNYNFSVCRSERFIPIKTDIFCDTADKFFTIIGVNAAVTPTTIIKKSFWLSTPGTVYSGTNWGLLAKLFYTLPGHSSYIISDPLVKFNESSTRSHEEGKFFEMALLLFGLIDKLPSLGYSKETYRKIRNQVINFRFLLTVVNEKINGLKVSIDLINRTSIALKQNCILFFISFILLIIPTSLYNFMKGFLMLIIKILKIVVSKLRNYHRV